MEDDLTADAVMVALFGSSAVHPNRVEQLGDIDSSGIDVDGVKADPLLFALLAARKYYQMGKKERQEARSWDLSKWVPRVKEELRERPDGTSPNARIPKPTAPAVSDTGDWRGRPVPLNDNEADAYSESRKRIKAYLRAASEEHLSDAALDSRVGAIISTEIQALFNESGIMAAVASNGREARVIRLPESGACKHCKRLFLDGEGQPKVFSVSEILSYGTNAGRKPVDWLPTLWPVHPNCRCSVEPVED